MSFTVVLDKVFVQLICRCYAFSKIFTLRVFEDSIYYFWMLETFWKDYSFEHDGILPEVIQNHLQKGYNLEIKFLILSFLLCRIYSSLLNVCFFIFPNAHANFHWSMISLNVVLISAVEQSESALCIHSTSLSSIPPSPHPTPLDGHRAPAPCVCSSFLLALFST